MFKLDMYAGMISNLMAMMAEETEKSAFPIERYKW